VPKALKEIEQTPATLAPQVGEFNVTGGRIEA
jgi:hypothetical protein